MIILDPNLGVVMSTVKGTILIMDDEDLIRNIASKMLEKLGYDVVSTVNGDEAIQVYRDAQGSDAPIDAVILDLTIPGGMGGTETVLKLKEIDSQVKAIVSTGYSNDPAVIEFEKHGFTAVINKPFKMEELEEVIIGVLS